MASYDLTQTSFLFSWVANSASAVTGSAPQLAQFLKLAFSTGGQWEWSAGSGSPTLTINGLIDEMGDQLIGQDWQLSWGPGIYQNNADNEADNAMAVLYSKSLDSYVVAIAGTNPSSPFDWLTEDLKVGPNSMVAFPLTNLTTAPVGGQADQDAVQVSLGTATGVYNLLTEMVDATGTPIRIQDYLSGLTPATGGSGSRIIFTGHSLGGALSPSLALQLLPSLTAWTAGNGQVCVMPTAGPSPGNGPFAQQWGSAFSPSPVEVNPRNLIDQLNVPYYDIQDVVPHAWQNIFDATHSYSDGSYPNLSCPAFFYNGRLLDKPITLESQIAQLANQTGLNDHKVASSLLTMITGLVQEAKAAFMQEMPGAKGLAGSFPLTYWDKTNLDWVQYSLPVSPVTTFEPFGQALALIHVWHYFQFFDIDPTAVIHIIQPSGAAPQTRGLFA